MLISGYSKALPPTPAPQPYVAPTPRAPSKRPAVDLTGQKIGRLLILGWVMGAGWRCRCDCGRSRFATTGKLAAGAVRSCGCLRPRRQP